MEDIMNRLIAAAHALNNIEIRGRNNIDNMSGALRLLDDAAAALGKYAQREGEFTEDEPEK